MKRYTKQQEQEYEQMLIEFVIWLFKMIIEALEVMGIEYTIEEPEQTVTLWGAK
jgi:hypothetical protein